MGLKLKSGTKKFVAGRGFMDIILPLVKTLTANKDLISNVGKSAVDLITTAKNIKAIATPKKATIDSVIKEIKGKGFNMIK